jgi:hypothetical protein
MFQTLSVTPAMSWPAATSLLHTQLTPAHYKSVVTGPTQVVDASSGNTVAFYAPGVFNSSTLSPLQQLIGLGYGTKYSRRAPVKGQGGREATWGHHLWQGKVQLTAHSTKYGEIYSVLQHFASHVSSVYKSWWAERWTAQEQMVNTAWALADGVPFTLASTNTSISCLAHLDGNNLQAGASCISVLTAGEFSGGVLVLPRLGLGFNLGAGDLFIGNLAAEVHGNTPIAGPGARTSIIFYCSSRLCVNR